jgi:hypothetical protein
VVEDLCKAIAKRAVLSIRYGNGNRVVEPYLVFESKDGKQFLHGWQVSGAWDESPPPTWCTLALDEISSFSPTGANFRQPHQGYNPTSNHFHIVLCHA